MLEIKNLHAETDGNEILNGFIRQVEPQKLISISLEGSVG